MMKFINDKDTLFEKSKLTPIRGEPTFEMIHKIRNETKANAKSVYSNLGGGEHGYLGLVLTSVQYALVSPILFIYPTHPGPIIILDGTTTHANSNMIIARTKKVRLLQEVTGVEQALVKNIFAVVEEAYLADICNHMTNSINNTVADMLTHLQDNYGQLPSHKLLNCEDIVKNMIYNPRDPIVTVFFTVE